MVVEAYGPTLLSSKLVLVVGTPSIGKLAEERVDACGAVCQGIREVAMLGDLQFPADDYHVISVIRSFSCQDVPESGPMARCISKRTWGRQSHRSRN
jgi:hypothetical protein